MMITVHHNSSSYLLKFYCIRVRLLGIELTGYKREVLMHNTLITLRCRCIRVRSQLTRQRQWSQNRSCSMNQSFASGRVATCVPYYSLVVTARLLCFAPFLQLCFRITPFNRQFLLPSARYAELREALNVMTPQKEVPWLVGIT